MTAAPGIVHGRGVKPLGWGSGGGEIEQRPSFFSTTSYRNRGNRGNRGTNNEIITMVYLHLGRAYGGVTSRDRPSQAWPVPAIIERTQGVRASLAQTGAEIARLPGETRIGERNARGRSG